MGTLPFDEAYALFAEQARAATAAGADLFIIETMADLAEAKAALLAVVENSDLPVFVTMTFAEDGRTVFDVHAPEYCRAVARMLDCVLSSRSER
jgi:5-methyltetrahydrofolate--homocysteine methyltransferase